jgi:hypothetical protein
MKKTLPGAALAFAAAVAVAVPAAHADCTLEQLQQKAMTYSQKIQDVAQKDPQKLQRFAPKAQEAAKKYQEAQAQRGTNYDDICRLYDEILAELEKS